MLCVGYILISALRQTGLRWWVIFSLSGYSAILAFLLIGLYLFAIFRGVDRSQKIEIEYPLTSSDCYTIFYDISPLLGGFAGYIGSIGVSSINGLIAGIALGTLATTFLMWIIVDPAIAFIEKLLPASRKHRLERLSKAKVLRQEQKEKRERLLAEILLQSKQEQTRLQEALKPQAEELAELLMAGKSDFEQAERTAIEIGARAWQIGGLSCMQQLRNMAITICGQKNQSGNTIDYIPVWWDGIGNWKNPAYCG